jgi:GNAT superfamily N-acetyltransferase
VIETRFPTIEDAELLKNWLLNPDTSRAFPLAEPKEVEDATKRWVELSLPEAGLVALYKGEPVGFGMFFLHNYERLKHQAYHVLVVDAPYRNLGIGSELLEALCTHGKEKHGLELTYTEVYDLPEVERFYRRRGFTECARQEDWARDGEESYARIVLERFI